MAGTFAGVNPELVWDLFTEDEQKVVKRMASQWYITNAGGKITGTVK